MLALLCKNLDYKPQSFNQSILRICFERNAPNDKASIFDQVDLLHVNHTLDL